MFLKIRRYVTLVVTLIIWTLLLWNHFHGGVPRHHILANEDLPAVSNWWGGLLLPLLTWFLLHRIQVRISNQNKDSKISESFGMILIGFACSLLFGILLSVFYTFGYSNVCGYMILILLPIGLFFPIYRAECLLGFVLGMTFTFGPVLPIGIGTILVLVGVVLYLFLRAAIPYAFSKFTSKELPGKQS